mgnify:CR=1 FL=1
MNKFKDISMTGVITIIIALIILLYIWEDNYEYEKELLRLDRNRDGVVSKAELKYYLTEVEKKKNKKNTSL